MRQRAMIAMALANTPRMLIADEPTTALDVTIQAQILELMQAMQRDFGSAVMLITHDLGVIAGMADRVLVMYGGRVVESGTVDEIFYEPQHPYTWGLLGSVPRLDLKADARLATIPGQPPNLLNMDDNRCPFAHRCKWVHDACLEGFPAYDDVSPTHRAACTLDAKARSELARSGAGAGTGRGGGGMSETAATDTPLDDEEPPLDPDSAAVGSGVEEALSDQVRCAAPPDRVGVCGGRRLLRRAGRVRRSAWWASRAAASRPRPGWCCG